MLIAFRRKSPQFNADYFDVAKSALGLFLWMMGANLLGMLGLYHSIGRNRAWHELCFCRGGATVFRWPESKMEAVNMGEGQ